MGHSSCVDLYFIMFAIMWIYYFPCNWMTKVFEFHCVLILHQSIWYTDLHLHTHTNTHIFHIHTFTHTYIVSHILAHNHTFSHIHIYTYLLTFTHILVLMHVHTHTHRHRGMQKHNTELEVYWYFVGKTNLC